MKLKQTDDGCWIWTGYTRPDGYGDVSIDGKLHRVHRVVYELLVGPIGAGLELDHVKARGCTSRACCNPAHLEPVTHLENVRRGDSGAYLRARTHCPHGHPYDEENTRLYRGRRYCWTCHRERKRRAS